MDTVNYKGWRIGYDSRYTVWRAVRFGVGMNNVSKDDLLKMVDRKVEDDKILHSLIESEQ